MSRQPPALLFAFAVRDALLARFVVAQDLAAAAQFGVKPSPVKRLNWNNFNWGSASRVFGAVIFVSSVLNIVDIAMGGADDGVAGDRVDRLFAIPFFMINFPSLPLLPYVNRASNDACIAVAVVIVYLSGGIFWSLVAGYVSGHKQQA